VSRGGEKLDAALERFRVDVTGRECLDAGASTGGFTDCLLSRGARHVVAVDVGYGQLDWRLREDARVTVLERTNVRHLDPGQIPYRPEIVTADLSFISLSLALPALTRCAVRGGTFVLLVKPQFEAGREDVGRGGVIGDRGAWWRSLERVAEAAAGGGLEPSDAMASPLLGPAGNAEFFLLAAGGEAVSGAPIGDRIQAALLDAEALVRRPGGGSDG
jgi:23S rRNA (cytidine1920-2'-O)/16S rRNA (cytidine1409-2'-O)-methyltransferase